MAVDLDAQAEASALAYGWAAKSFGFRDAGAGAVLEAPVAGFAAWLDLPGGPLALTADGIGTKLELAERMGRYDTLGWDLLAMVCDDLAAAGAEPVAVTNVLDVDRVDPAAVDALLGGLHAAAQAAKVALAGGEIAELGSRVAGYGAGMHANWSATAVGRLRPGWQPIDGRAVLPGHAVVALASDNFRSNGFTVLRTGLQRALGDGWHLAPCGDRRWGDALLEPSTLYCPLVTALRAQGVHPSGIAHVTGGGIPAKLGRVLAPQGLGAVLEQLWPPTAAMLQAEALCEVGLYDAWRHFGRGNGMLLVVAPEQVPAVQAQADALGLRARQAGVVVASPALHLYHGDAACTSALPGKHHVR
ncbi:MAG: phosphoribosylformylglycinamidine cyclo-ligase [Deltaproteobacteria bacterium]|nr:phosphoribosylformylglycinamidine cyclo-ligase [Deltaproteobacteria bacterium]